MKKLTLFIVFVILYSCEEKKITSKEYYNNFEKQKKEQSLIQKITLEIDTIKVKKNILDLGKESEIYFSQLFSFKEKIKSVEI